MRGVMDTLSQVLRAVRLSGALLFWGEFWSKEERTWFPASHRVGPMLGPKLAQDFSSTRQTQMEGLLSG